MYTKHSTQRCTYMERYTLSHSCTHAHMHSLYYAKRCKTLGSIKVMIGYFIIALLICSEKTGFGRRTQCHIAPYPCLLGLRGPPPPPRTAKYIGKNSWVPHQYGDVGSIRSRVLWQQQIATQNKTSSLTPKSTRVQIHSCGACDLNPFFVATFRKLFGPRTQFASPSYIQSTYILVSVTYLFSFGRKKQNGFL